MAVTEAMLTPCLAFCGLSVSEIMKAETTLHARADDSAK
jgi:hypothetical protein